MERIVKAFITLIVVLLVATLFMVNLICSISKIILLECTQPRLRRPARIVNGDYGPIIFPNSGDAEAVKAFMKEQRKLAHKAKEDGDKKRLRHHIANMVLAFDDPMAVLIKCQSKFTLHTYQFIQAHIGKHLHNCQWRGASKEVD